METVTTFVFVHGAWHGGWCWTRLAERMGTAAKIVAPDLLGMGGDPTPPERVSFAGWLEALSDVISHEAEPIVLVGHSMGGHVICGLAERCADALAAVVHVTTLPPAPGESISDSAGALHGRLTRLDEAPKVFNADQTAVRLADDADVRAILYNRCSEADVAFACERLGWQPVAPYSEPIAWGERCLSVPHYYVECARDQALPVEVQREVQARFPFRRTFHLAADHSPFFSAVEPLHAALQTVAREVSA